MEWLEAASNAVTALGGLAMLFSYAVIRPMKDMVEETRDDVKEIKCDLDEEDKRIRDLEVKFTEVDQRARSAHHRIDDICALRSEEA